jgi:predicted glycosyltransferase
VNVWRLIEELSKIATVVYLPRYREEKEQIEHLKDIWMPPKTVLTSHLLPYVDIVIGSGGTICRESALMGIPTISFHFWDAIAKYLRKRSFPIRYIADTKEIIKKTKRIIKNPDKFKVNTKDKLTQLQSPIVPAARCIEEYFAK